MKTQTAAARPKNLLGQVFSYDGIKLGWSEEQFLKTAESKKWHLKSTDSISSSLRLKKYATDGSQVLVKNVFWVPELAFIWDKASSSYRLESITGRVKTADIEKITSALNPIYGQQPSHVNHRLSWYDCCPSKKDLKGPWTSQITVELFPSSGLHEVTFFHCYLSWLRYSKIRYLPQVSH